MTRDISKDREGSQPPPLRTPTCPGHQQGLAGVRVNQTWTEERERSPEVRPLGRWWSRCGSDLEPGASLAGVGGAHTRAWLESSSRRVSQLQVPNLGRRASAAHLPSRGTNSK